MKPWKESIAAEIISRFERHVVINFPPVGQTDRAIKFSDVVKSLGYTHICRTDIADIAHKVQQLRPELHPVRFVNDLSRTSTTESLWSTLYFTDLEFD